MTILQFLKSFPHVYEYHLQCAFTFVASIFLQLLLVLSHGPNHCFTSSSPPSIPHCPIAVSSSRIFLSVSRTEPVLKYCSIVMCTQFPFQRVLIHPKLIPNKGVMSILSQRCNLFRISERAASKVFAISPCTGLQIH